MQELFSFIQSQNVEALRAALLHYSDPSPRALIDSKNLLHYAVSIHSYQIIKLLVETFNADVDYPGSDEDFDGKTPAMLSLESSFNVDYTDPFYFDMTRYFLLERNANVTVIDKNGMNFLELAVLANNDDAIDILTRDETRASTTTSTILGISEDEMMRKRKKDEFFKFCESFARSSRSSLSISGNNVLHYAALSDAFHDIKKIYTRTRSVLKLNPNKINKRYETPFMIACLYGFYETCKELLDIGTILTFRTDDTNLTYLHTVCISGYLKIARMILESTVISNPLVLDEYLNLKTTRGTTAFHFASLPCKPSDLLSYLLSFQSANVLVKDTYGNTPLHNACLVPLAQKQSQKSQTNLELEEIHLFAFDICKTLLEHEPKILSLKNKEGKNPLFFAAKYNLKHIVQLFLENSYENLIDTDEKDNFGKTADEYCSFSPSLALLIKNHKKRKDDLRKPGIVTRDQWRGVGVDEARITFLIEFIDLDLTKNLKTYYLERKHILDTMNHPSYENYFYYPLALSDTETIYVDKLALRERLEDFDEKLVWLVETEITIPIDNELKTETSVFTFRSTFVSEKKERGEERRDEEEREEERRDKEEDEEEEDFYFWK